MDLQDIMARAGRPADRRRALLCAILFLAIAGAMIAACLFALTDGAHGPAQHFRDCGLSRSLGTCAIQAEQLAALSLLRAALPCARCVHPRPVKDLTFLREPVARLLSHYNFWRSDDDVIDRRIGSYPLREADAAQGIARALPLCGDARMSGTCHAAAGGGSAARAVGPTLARRERTGRSALANLANMARLG